MNKVYDRIYIQLKEYAKKLSYNYIVITLHYVIFVSTSEYTVYKYFTSHSLSEEVTSFYFRLFRYKEGNIKFEILFSTPIVNSYLSALPYHINYFRLLSV